MYDDFSSEEFKRDFNELVERCTNLDKGGIVADIGKYIITDEAINRIPYIKFPGFTEEQCLRIQQLEKMLLNIARLKNNSNEAVLTYRLDGDSFSNATERIAVAYGNEERVDVFSDEKTKRLFETSKELMIISIHNHPNDTFYSFNDLLFFYKHDEIRLFNVVTNTGNISSLSRNDLYLKNEAFTYLIDLLKNNVPNFTESAFNAIKISREHRMIAYAVMKKWLNNIESFGLNYREGVLKSGKPAESDYEKNNDYQDGVLRKEDTDETIKAFGDFIMDYFENESDKQSGQQSQQDGNFFPSRIPESLLVKPNAKSKPENSRGGR